MFPTYLLLMAAFVAYVHSYPNRGHYPFVIAVCKHKDRLNEPITTDRVREFFTAAGSSKPGMYQFLREQSSGAVDLEGTIVGGWYTTSQTFDQTATVSRQQRLNTCRDAALAGGMVIPAVSACPLFLFSHLGRLKLRQQLDSQIHGSVQRIAGFWRGWRC